ncbi:MAG: hypothetical protein ACJAYI_001433, partial [Myxococcota bacterium]
PNGYSHHARVFLPALVSGTRELYGGFGEIGP